MNRFESLGRINPKTPKAEIVKMLAGEAEPGSYEEPVEDTSIGLQSVLKSPFIAARGVAGGALGTPGDFESLARIGLNALGADVSPETFLPTSHEASEMVGKVIPFSTPENAAERIVDNAGQFIGGLIGTKGIGRGVSALKAGANPFKGFSQTAQRGYAKASEFGEAVKDAYGAVKHKTLTMKDLGRGTLEFDKSFIPNSETLKQAGSQFRKALFSGAALKGAKQYTQSALDRAGISGLEAATAVAMGGTSQFAEEMGANPFVGGILGLIAGLGAQKYGKVPNAKESAKIAKSLAKKNGLEDLKTFFDLSEEQINMLNLPASKQWLAKNTKANSKTLKVMDEISDKFNIKAADLFKNISEVNLSGKGFKQVADDLYKNSEKLAKDKSYMVKTGTMSEKLRSLLNKNSSEGTVITDEIQKLAGFIERFEAKGPYQPLENMAQLSRNVGDLFGQTGKGGMFGQEIKRYIYDELRKTDAGKDVIGILKNADNYWKNSPTLDAAIEALNPLNAKKLQSALKNENTRHLLEGVMSKEDIRNMQHIANAQMSVDEVRNLFADKSFANTMEEYFLKGANGVFVGTSIASLFVGGLPSIAGVGVLGGQALSYGLSRLSNLAANKIIRSPEMTKKFLKYLKALKNHLPIAAAHALRDLFEDDPELTAALGDIS